jgi:osmoprotectant transport system permease protein
MILAEIAAQHLEKQLGVPIERRTDLGSAPIAYEALVLSTIDIYPEDTNAIMVSVLKDALDPNPDSVLLRVQNEMPRLGRIQVLSPLGIHRRPCVVVRARDASDGKIQTLSEAARSRLAWTLGVTSEFQQRSDGFTALMSAYNLPLKVPPKPFPPASLYPALTDSQVAMVAGYDTDGPLSGNEFIQLKDDKGAFHEARTCFLVRQGAIDSQPKVKEALTQLSGKFTNDSIRKLNYEVDVSRRPVTDVAAEFLRQAGLR